MIELVSVSKTYHKRGNSVTAFDAKNLKIHRGEYAAVVGPSGSGKTTLLSILGGMLSPDEGEVLLDGVSLYHLKVPERAQLRRDKIGFVFQTFNLLGYLTAVENVQVPLYLAGHTATDSRQIAIGLLENIGLGKRLDHKPAELSIGQQQRVALARTLANDPALILADEPTGNLDPESRECVLSLFDTLVAGGKTIVMVTHDTSAAKRAQRELRLQDGKLCDPQSLRAVA